MILLTHFENVIKFGKTNKKQSYPCGVIQRVYSNEVKDFLGMTSKDNFIKEKNG